MMPGLRHSDVNIFVKRDACYACGICVERCILDNLRLFMAPCRVACPIHMNCQGYVRLLAQGKEVEAAKEMRNGLPFSGILGRVCTRPCEEKCERRKVDNQPVHIRALKRYLADRWPEISRDPPPIGPKTGRRVAIVGSGPAGLMAAHQLVMMGHAVIVFDSASEPGGMPRWVIPAFRLPVEEIRSSLQMLEEREVVFQTGRSLGKDLDLEQLENEWDAVLLATGAGIPMNLGIPGEGLKGVHRGLDFLRDVRDGRRPPLGKSVIVIGGGNTAVDVALTCRKMGVKGVDIVCLEEKGKMPAFEAERRETLEEGIVVRDCWGPTEIVYRGEGPLQLKLSQCLRVFDDTGRFSPLLENKCGLQLSAESIIVAIGQKPAPSHYSTGLGEGGSPEIPVDPMTMQTRRPKVFAAGDVVFGTQSAVEAMAQGMEAATSIDRMLRGESLKWGRTYWKAATVTDFPIDHSRAIVREQVKLPRKPVNVRDLYTEVEQRLESHQARAEAERCLSCGRPAEVNQTCWYCLPCEIECPVDALEVRLPYLVR